MAAAPSISTDYRPGLLGEIARAHARYYAKHWGFGRFFETKVASEGAAFLDRMGAGDLCLSAWRGEDFAGSLIVDRHDPDAAEGWAHLRWFIVTERGGGLGGELMARATAFLDQHAAPCFLTTFKGLDPARRLYEKHGFRLVDERPTTTWGATVSEQRFERAGASP